MVQAMQPHSVVAVAAWKLAECCAISYDDSWLLFAEDTAKWRAVMKLDQGCLVAYCFGDEFALINHRLRKLRCYNTGSDFS